MKNSTNDKNAIGKYAAMAGAFIAGSSVNAQIIYADINPDAVVDINTPFTLDMDVNGVNDFEFKVQTLSGGFTYYGGLVNIAYSGIGAGVSGLNGGIMGSVSSQASMNIASALITSNLVDSNGSFLSDGILAADVDVVVTGLYSTSFTQYPGNFKGQTDKFIGVNFDINGNNHYGWVRLDVNDACNQIIVKDYAYNAVPNLPLYAGQTVGLDDISVADKVNFKTMLDGATVNVTPDLLGGEIKLIDMQGRIASTKTINDINTTILYKDLNSGIYMLSVEANNETVTKKVYVH